MAASASTDDDGASLRLEQRLEVSDARRVEAALPWAVGMGDHAGDGSTARAGCYGSNLASDTG